MLFRSNQVRGFDRREIQREGMTSPAPGRTVESPSVLSPGTQSTSNGNGVQGNGVQGKYRQSSAAHTQRRRRLTQSCSHLLRSAGPEFDCVPLPVLPLPLLESVHPLLHLLPLHLLHLRRHAPPRRQFQAGRPTSFPSSPTRRFRYSTRTALRVRRVPPGSRSRVGEMGSRAQAGPEGDGGFGESNGGETGESQARIGVRIG